MKSPRPAAIREVKNERKEEENKSTCFFLFVFLSWHRKNDLENCCYLIVATQFERLSGELEGWTLRFVTGILQG